MKNTAISVPGALLLDRDLTGTAKLLWMALQVAGTPAPPGILKARCGFDRHTILRGLSRLKSAGWLPAIPVGGHATSQQWALVPDDLLLDSRLGAQAKVFYGIVQLIPGFGAPRGRFTYPELSGQAGMSPTTVKQAIRALQDTGWLQISQKNKYSPIHFALQNPAEQRREREVAEAARRLEEASFLGEALMREYLSLIVDSDEYEDNATPGFLVNPYTGERMQFDRYYPPRAAFEFQGSQHYGPTARYPRAADASKQQGRDCMKIGISALRGIMLVAVRPQDLVMEVMRRHVNGLLPLRELAGHEPLITYLESVSRAYRRKARKHAKP